MDIILKRKNLTLSKSLDEWVVETEHYCSFYYERYAQSFGDRNCTNEMQRHYCNVAKNYWNLNYLLSHIKTYGTFFNDKKCIACQSKNPHHIQLLQATYQQYQKWINRLSVPPKN